VTFKGLARRSPPSPISPRFLIYPDISGWVRLVWGMRWVRLALSMRLVWGMRWVRLVWFAGAERARGPLTRSLTEGGSRRSR
jgi:hypothetical protein